MCASFCLRKVIRTLRVLSKSIIVLLRLDSRLPCISMLTRDVTVCCTYVYTKTSCFLVEVNDIIIKMYVLTQLSVHFILQNLKHLNLSYLRHVNPGVLSNVMASFSSLVSLNLRMTLAVDQARRKQHKNLEQMRDKTLADFHQSIFWFSPKSTNLFRNWKSSFLFLQ